MMKTVLEVKGNDTDYQVEIAIITPELAAAWLELNHSNRPLRDKVVDAYARDMANDKWQFTFQGIAFDRNGTLIDGQHRLSAIVKSGKTIKLMVFRNFDNAVNIDTHAKRTTSDILGVTDKAVATVSTIYRVQQNSHNRLTVDEIDKMLREHGEAVNFATAYHKTMARFLNNSAVVAAIAVASYFEDNERLKQFCEIFNTGVAYGQEDSAVIKLRDWLRSPENIHPGSYAGRNVIYLLTEAAIKAFCKRTPIEKLVLPKSEVYPLKKVM